MEKIKTKFKCVLQKKVLDIEDCLVCSYRDDCIQSERYHAGYCMKRIVWAAFLITIIGGFIVWRMFK